MLRNILAVVGGYVVLALVVTLGMLVLAFSLGRERLFQEGSYDPATALLVWELAIGLVATLVGGWVAALIAPRFSRAPLVLALFVLVVGVTSEGVRLATDAPDAPDAAVVAREKSELGLIELARRADEHGRKPVWSLVLLPLVGFGGVLAGAALRRRQAPLAG